MKKYLIFKNITITPNIVDGIATSREINIILVDESGDECRQSITYSENVSMSFKYDMNYFIDEVMIYLANGKYHTVESVKNIVENAFLNCMKPRI